MTGYVRLLAAMPLLGLAVWCAVAGVAATAAAEHVAGGAVVIGARARSARQVTALIRRLQEPVPSREYEHKQRLLDHARRRGVVTSRDGRAALGLTTGNKTVQRLLVELAAEGLLERRGSGSLTHYVPAGAS